MPCQVAVYQQEWTATVQEALPQLSKPQATVLALFSLGMVFARSCAVSAVAAVLAVALDQSVNTVRQRLREFAWDAEAKAGEKRREIAVETCFVPLLRWILSRWQGTQLALALDATTLGDRFVVLALSVVYRGCAIPVAWTLLPAGEKHAWRREWLRMLRLLHPAVPPTWTVLVLADRGLYARWLFRRIVRLGWHPFLRINRGGTFRPTGKARFVALRTFAPQTGTSWGGSGTAFSTYPLACTLLARWEEGHQDPWLILTDLAPASCDPCWYGLRMWIERGFKLTKRGGWQWQATRMSDPERAARLWVVIAVATLWLVSVGGEAEADAETPESAFAPLDAALPAQTHQRRATRLRTVAIFRQGLIRLVLAMLDHEPLPFGRFVPEPWPTASPLTITTLPQEDTSQ